MQEVIQVLVPEEEKIVISAVDNGPAIHPDLPYLFENPRPGAVDLGVLLKSIVDHYQLCLRSIEDLDPVLVEHLVLEALRPVESVVEGHRNDIGIGIEDYQRLVVIPIDGPDLKC